MFSGGFVTFMVDFATFQGTIMTFTGFCDTGVCDVYCRYRSFCHQSSTVFPEIIDKIKKATSSIIFHFFIFLYSLL